MSKEADVAAAEALLALAKSEPDVVASDPVVAAEVVVDETWLDAAARFDPSKPYGRVMDGSGTSRARYQQGNNFFDHAGELVKE